MTKPTQTTNRIHFADLDPLRFEDLCLNLIYPLNDWIDIRHYGRAGSDGGVDIFAIEKLPNGAFRDWFVQCRRYGKATKATLKQAVKDALEKSQKPPEVLLVIVTCDIRRESHEFYIEYARENGVGLPMLWTQSIIEAKLYSERKDLLFTYFRISTVSRERNQEAVVRRKVALKKRMQKDFIKDSYDPYVAIRLPYSRFKVGEAIIHSIDDTIYPNVDTEISLGISPWFKVELYNFYHNGLEVVLGGAHGIMDEEGRWAVIEYNQKFDTETYFEVTMMHLGRIPYRNIVEYDLNGDEYYNCPHIYCVFADRGMPYEEFTYRLINDNYHPLLSSELRFVYQSES